MKLIIFVVMLFVLLLAVIAAVMAIYEASMYMDDSFRWGEKENGRD